MRTFRWLVFATILSLIVSPLGLVHSEPENTFTTTSVLDTVDAAPGDGECADSNGACTLRAAVMEANASAGLDTIKLLADTYALTIAGRGEDNAATGDLDLNGTLTIIGTGAETTVIDAELSSDRVFQINSGSNVTISGVTIRNGKSGNQGSGIWNIGKLFLINSDVNGNINEDGWGTIGNSGEIIVTNTIIRDNNVFVFGGGIYNFETGKITLTDSVIGSNYAYTNGGIDNRGEMTITNSIVSNNISTKSAGGINNGGKMIIANSTISGNQAGQNGGGIFNNDAGDIAIINSTISGNSANGLGGGIYTASTGTLEARNATIVSNTANADGNGISTYGGGIANDGVAVRLFNTILGLNIHVIINQFGPLAVNDDCKGTLNQLSYSLLTTTTGCTYTSDNSITGENPKLEALTDNGGPTQTRALKADSPAIDAGDPNGCKDAQGNLLTTDQRGEPRTFDGNMDGAAICDIGAYEFVIYQGLTVDKAGMGDGRVTSSPVGIDCGQDCSSDFLQDSVVKLTADPDAGSSFNGWSGACSGASDCQLTLDAAKTVTATFELDQQLTVIIAGTGNGRVISSPTGIDCGSNCSATFTQDTLVTLTADPDEGSSFTGWSGACSGAGDCQVTMDAEKSVTATFDVITATTHKLFLPLSLR